MHILRFDTLYRNPADGLYYPQEPPFSCDPIEGVFYRLHESQDGWTFAESEDQAIQNLRFAGFSFQQIVDRSNIAIFPDFLDIVQEDFSKNGEAIPGSSVIFEKANIRVFKLHDFVKGETTYFHEVDGTVKNKITI